MTKAEIESGLARGLVFVQRANASSQEKLWVEELIAENKARCFWAFVDPGYTSRMVRLVRRKGEGPKVKPPSRWLDEHASERVWEYPSKPSMFLLHLSNYGLYPVWIGFLLRKLARDRGQYPTPLTPEFLYDLARHIARYGKTYNYDIHSFRRHVSLAFHRIMYRIEQPMTPVERYDHIVDHFLAWYGLAPLPTIVGEKHWTTYLPN
jgi:hypothetical protein